MVKKKSARSSRGRAVEGVRTRERMVDAALKTLVEEGYAGCTARSIATRGNFNPALVFYHYGGVDDLLLAALDRSSAERLKLYREILSETLEPQALIRRAADLFRQGVEDGYVTVVTELVGASLSKPELRSEVIARMQPWLELTQKTIERLLADSAYRDLAPAAGPAAFAIMSGYLGLNMLSRLMPDQSQTEALFKLLEELARLVPRR